MGEHHFYPNSQIMMIIFKISPIGTGMQLQQLKKLVRIDKLPCISISGQVARRNTKAYTFDIDVFQYTSFGRGLSPLPISIIIPDNGKYKQSKRRPMPGENAFVTVVGPMTHIIGENKFQRRFGVELDKIYFLCRANATSMSANATNVKPIAGESLRFRLCIIYIQIILQTLALKR